MSIRQGYYLIGDTVQVAGSLKDAVGEPIEAGTVSVFVRNPNGVLTNYQLTPILGEFGMDIPASVAGKWRIRVECDLPKPTSKEGSFIVVPSDVLPPAV